MKGGNTKILCVLQLPPPVHGASLMNERLLSSALIRDAYTLRVRNIVTAHEIESIGRFSLKKLGASIRFFFLILWDLLFFRPELVYCTLSPSGFAFYRDAAYVFLFRLTGTRRVFHLHGKGFRTGAARSSFFRMIGRFVIKGSYTIHMSPVLSHDLDGFSPRRSFIVPYGIPVVDYPKGEKERKGPLSLLFLSNYVRSKGILDLVEAAARLAQVRRDFHLNLVGKPYDVSSEFLEKLLREKGIEDLVTVCGPRYAAEKYAVLASSDLFVFPTWYPNEAFPLSLLEAMQFGLPCITTAEGGIPDLIRDGQNGFLVPKQDPQALADKMLLLLDQPEKMESMGKAARKDFLENYTLAHFEKGMYATFEAIRNDRR